MSQYIDDGSHKHPALDFPDPAADATDEEPPHQSVSVIFAKSISKDFASQQMVFCLVANNDDGCDELWWPAVRYENIIEASALCNDQHFQAAIGIEVFDALKMRENNASPPVVYKLLGCDDGRHLTDEVGDGKKVETLLFNAINLVRFYCSTPRRNVYFKDNEHLFQHFRHSMQQARELLKLSTEAGRNKPFIYALQFPLAVPEPGPAPCPRQSSSRT